MGREGPGNAEWAVEAAVASTFAALGFSPKILGTLMASSKFATLRAVFACMR